MFLNKEQIKQYKEEGFLVEKVKDALKEMEKIPKEELLLSIITQLFFLGSFNLLRVFFISLFVFITPLI